MTPVEARKALSNSWPHHLGEKLVLKGPESTNIFEKVKVVGNKVLVFVGNEGNKVTFPLKEITVEAATDGKVGEVAISYDAKRYGMYRSSKKGSVTPLTSEGTRNFTDAILVLKKVAFDEDQYESYYEKIISASNTAPNKTVLPEEVRRYKVQAESAIKEKSYYEASELFRAALNIAPWWADGHFNRALVLGEAGELDLAILEMRRYLFLVPNATDARAAHNMIYGWERSLGKQD
jgi:tetratricopeptide (TPR) repeat protein